MAHLKVMFGRSVQKPWALYAEFRVDKTVFLHAAKVRGREKKRVDPNNEFSEMYYARPTQLNPYGTLYFGKSEKSGPHWIFWQARAGKQEITANLPLSYELRVVVM